MSIAERDSPAADTEYAVRRLVENERSQEELVSKKTLTTPVVAAPERVCLLWQGSGRTWEHSQDFDTCVICFKGVRIVSVESLGLTRSRTSTIVAAFLRFRRTYGSSLCVFFFSKYSDLCEVGIVRYWVVKRFSGFIH